MQRGGECVQRIDLLLLRGQLLLLDAGLILLRQNLLIQPAVLGKQHHAQHRQTRGHRPREPRQQTGFPFRQRNYFLLLGHPTKNFGAQLRRRFDAWNGTGQRTRRHAQTSDIRLQFGISVQFLFEFARLIRRQRAEDVQRGLLFHAFVNHSKPSSWSRNFSRPRRMRALMVPSGSFNFFEISSCVRPEKYASSMAWRCSAGSSPMAD